ncbi:MAG: response regulator [Mariprofundaceae bacterium]
MDNTIKILAIDDEDTVQSIIAAFMGRFLDDKNINHEIKSLNDPVQGLFELSTNGNQYDAILLDVRLPKLTGDEIYNSLMHVNPGLLERILFITGYPEDLSNRFPDKTMNILQKPFRFEDFTEKLNSILKL